MDVFISYSHADSQWAEKLIKTVEKHGLSVWTDRGNLLPGQQWQDELELALASAQAIVLLVGPKQAQDKIQEVAWRAALEESWTNSYKPLIPVLIKNAKLPKFLLPWRTKALHIERNSPKDWQEAVSVLIGAIESYASLPTSSEDTEDTATFDPPPYSSAAGDPELPGFVSEREDRLSYIEEAASSMSADPPSSEDPPERTRRIRQ